MDKGEGSALGLVLEMEAKIDKSIFDNKICLILDDREANYEIKKMKLNIEIIRLPDVFVLALDKKLCNEKELEEIIKILSKKGRIFNEKDTKYIFGKNEIKERGNR